MISLPRHFAHKLHNLRMFSCNMLPLVCLVTVFAGTTLGYEYENMDCSVSGRCYRHDQTFSFPGHSKCLKYSCFYGKVSKSMEACEHNSECHRVGSTWNSKCIQYKCKKIVDGDMTTYRTEIVKTRCRDVNGQCRNDRETFPFAMNGVEYSKCTCKISDKNINYKCTSTYSRYRSVSEDDGYVEEVIPIPVGNVTIEN